MDANDDQSHSDFLTAIAAEPDEVFPRLVYADWLDENREFAQAEFIRAQVGASQSGPKLSAEALAQRKELRELSETLLRKHHAEWDARYRRLILATVPGASLDHVSWEYRCGMPELVRVLAERGPAPLAEIARLMPARVLVITNPSEYLHACGYRIRSVVDSLADSGAKELVVRVVGFIVGPDDQAEIERLIGLPCVSGVDLSNCNFLPEAKSFYRSLATREHERMQTPETASARQPEPNRLPLRDRNRKWVAEPAPLPTAWWSVGLLVLCGAATGIWIEAAEPTGEQKFGGWLAMVALVAFVSWRLIRVSEHRPGGDTDKDSG